MKLQTLLVIAWLSEFYCIRYALREKFSWAQLDFQFPNQSARNEALATNSYIPDHNVIWAIGVWKDKMFVTLFRHRPGVVSSLNYFSVNSDIKSPVLIPYPSFDANYVRSSLYDRPAYNLQSESSMICCAYFHIDYKCDRLWVIDAGFDDFFGSKLVLTQPALVIIDLNTNKLIRRYTLPAEFVTPRSIFSNLEIDIIGNCCDDAFAYIGDLDRSIVVYSLRKNRSWRLTHNYLASDPQYSNVSFSGLEFQWNYGVMGITLGEYHKDGSRRVYLTPFTSTKTFYISNKVLQDEAYITLNKYLYDVHFLGDRGENAQIFRYIYDEKTNVLFDSQFRTQRIGCWNIKNRFTNSSFGVVYASDELFFASDIIIDWHRNLWMLTDNYPINAYGCWDDANSGNIRIYKGKVLLFRELFAKNNNSQ